MTDGKPQPLSVADWLEAFDPAARELDTVPWGDERLKRLHGQQMVLDVIAHVQNIPLRLLRIENLVDLDQTFVRFVQRWRHEILTLFTEANLDGSPRVPRTLDPSAAASLVEAMQEPRHMHTLRDWILQLGDRSVPDSTALLQPPPTLPPHYAEWFLMLLPHVERDVWLTEMGNPLPAHNLARMVEHCSLYILMWAWSMAPAFREAVERLTSAEPIESHEIPLFERTLGFERLALALLPVFRRRGREGSRDVVLLAGPFLLDATDDTSDWFTEPLLDFLGRVERVQDIEGWDEVREKAPGRSELHDALESRAGINVDEAQRRALQSRNSLRLLLASHIDTSVTRWPDGRPGRPISRANWETITVLAAWFDRWGRVVYQSLDRSRSDALSVSIDRHRVSLLVSGEPDRPELLFYGYEQPDQSPVEQGRWARLADSLQAVRHASDWRWIEGPSTFFARMRERQQAAWTSHVAAINNLLARHSRRDRPEGADDPEARLAAPTACEEVDHLLRGFGGRVCRYLLSMARAEVAVIYWLDYGSDPPRLRHVSGAERLIQHRAKRQQMLSRFNAEIWERRADSSEDTLRRGIDLGIHSPFQVYRAAARGHIEPRPEDRKAREQAEVAAPLGGGRLDVFEMAGNKPLDVVSVPLLFNDRVVGLFGLAGIASTRQFDLRLHPTLRLVAHVLAQAMYFQSQVWHMRQINWLASHVPLEEWRQHNRANKFNPLLRVARCLANIFLCAGVQIWLRDKQNPTRYFLHGNTAPDIFLEDGQPPEHAPHLKVRGRALRAPTELSRSFLAFAVDQWTRATISDAEPEPSTPGELQPMPLGRYVQAQYIDGDERTLNYGLAIAERGLLELHADFLDASMGPEAVGSDALPTLRRALYIDRGWAQTMAFALIRGENGNAEPVGVVGLYAAARPSRRQFAPWPPGWRTVVAHVQTYLPYVLMQTEAIANPLDDLRRYLLHEGRNELNATSEQAGQLKRHLQQLLAVDAPLGGTVRPWLRRIMPRIQDNPSLPAGELLRELAQLDKALADVAEKVDKLMTVERGENMAMLGRLIERQRDISSLGLNFDTGERLHDMRWLPLRAGIHDLFSSYASELRTRHVWWSIDQLPESIQLLTQSRLWQWMLGDLVHNLVKYADANSGAQVTFSAPTPLAKSPVYRLRIRNEAVYDPETDRPERLVLHGVQGSAGLQRREQVPNQTKISRVGTGIGLWGVNLLAQALHMSLEIGIQPQRSRPRHALYSFDLLIPVDLVRR